MTEFNRRELNRQLVKNFDKTDEKPEDILVEYEPGVHIKYLIPFLFILVTLFIGYSWYNDKFTISSGEQTIAVIKADKKPVRFKPQDPGGQEFAYKDKTIYNTISSKPENKDKISILPPPEKPLTREDISNLLPSEEQVLKQNPLDILIAKNLEETPSDKPTEESFNNNDITSPTSNLDAKNDDSQIKTMELASSNFSVDKSKSPSLETTPLNVPLIVKEDIYPNQVEIISSENKDSNSTSKLVDIPSPKKTNILTQLDNKDSTPQKKPINNTEELITDRKKNLLKSGSYFIQLGSFRSAKDVDTQWQNLKKKHKDILEKLNYNSQKADLGSKGVFYRLLSGPFSNEGGARSTCKKLKELSQDCFLYIN